MRSKGTGARTLLIGSLLALTVPMACSPALARSAHVTAEKPHERASGDARLRSSARNGASKHGWTKSVTNAKHGMKGRYAYAGGMQCVTFARSASGIELAGNAANWWDNAAGLYARGSEPQAGSVLNFRANGRMRMGHVAVVAEVVNARVIEIDHANWAGPGAVRGGVSRGIRVVDVSENNDWTAVRVALGHSGDFGSIYPTYGFIYAQSDGTGPTLANTASASEVVPEAALPVINPPPRDLRYSFPHATTHYVAWRTEARHHPKGAPHAHPLKLSLND